MITGFSIKSNVPLPSGLLLLWVVYRLRHVLNLVGYLLYDVQDGWRWMLGGAFYSFALLF